LEIENEKETDQGRKTSLPCGNNHPKKIITNLSHFPFPLVSHTTFNLAAILFTLVAIYAVCDS